MWKIIAISAVIFMLGCSRQHVQQPDTHGMEGNAHVVKTSVQLYSVRDALAEDFKQTLSTLAKLGIDGVEFAGDYGPYAEDPAGLRAFLAELGLQASGAHLSFDALRKEQFDATVDFHTQLGTPFLIIPWDERAFSSTEVGSVVSDLQMIATQLRGTGIQVGYHNHAQELADFQNATYWDYIAQNTSPDVVLQLDVGWVLHTGQEPTDYINKYPGRTLTTHFKPEVVRDGGISPIIGEDGIDWLTILNTAKSSGGAQWIVIEQEVYPNGLTPMEALACSVAGFQQIQQHSGN